MWSTVSQNDEHCRKIQLYSQNRLYSSTVYFFEKKKSFCFFSTKCCLLWRLFSQEFWIVWGNFTKIKNLNMNSCIFFFSSFAPHALSRFRINAVQKVDTSKVSHGCSFLICPPTEVSPINFKLVGTNIYFTSAVKAPSKIKIITIILQSIEVNIQRHWANKQQLLYFVGVIGK